MSHWGVRKVPKKCHVLFEWPLSDTNRMSPNDTRESKLKSVTHYLKGSTKRKKDFICEI